MRQFRGWNGSNVRKIPVWTPLASRKKSRSLRFIARRSIRISATLEGGARTGMSPDSSRNTANTRRKPWTKSKPIANSRPSRNAGGSKASLRKYGSSRLRNSRRGKGITRNGRRTYRSVRREASRETPPPAGTLGSQSSVQERHLWTRTHGKGRSVRQRSSPLRPRRGGGRPRGRQPRVLRQVRRDRREGREVGLQIPTRS